jgi:ribosomal protein S18 acetylase RimI-like enzyme
MLLRVATEGDLSEVVELVNLAYRGVAGWAVEGQFIEGERITLAGLREDLAAKPDALLLIWRDDGDGVLLGSVWLEPYKDGAWYLGLLNVRPDMQDRQLGRRLLAAAEEEAKERGATRIRMSVLNVRDTLIAWYQRRGYGLTGERRAFPYGHERLGRPLREDLEFLILEKAV